MRILIILLLVFFIITPAFAKVSRGPVAGELGVEVGAFIEFNNEGISDFGILGELKASVGTDILDNEIIVDDNNTPDPDDDTKFKIPGIDEQKLEFGVNVRSSWNAGTVVSGKGVFEGSRVSYK
jgi:hypothetical protein